MVGKDANPPIIARIGGLALTVTHKHHFSVSAFVSVMALVMVDSLSSVVISQGAFINTGKNGH